MPRIKCNQPSTGRPVWIRVTTLGTSWVTVAEAPDFSIFDPSANTYLDRDPLDASFGLAAGEVFLNRPVLCRNLLGTGATIEARVVFESGAINTGLGTILVPPGDTAQFTLQGLALIKRNFSAANGDRLQMRASDAASFDIIGAAQERLVAEHIGVIP